jgi:hypothetical protein
VARGSQLPPRCNAATLAAAHGQKPILAEPCASRPSRPAHIVPLGHCLLRPCQAANASGSVKHGLSPSSTNRQSRRCCYLPTRRTLKPALVLKPPAAYICIQRCTPFQGPCSPQAACPPAWRERPSTRAPWGARAPSPSPAAAGARGGSRSSPCSSPRWRRQSTPPCASSS